MTIILVKTFRFLSNIVLAGDWKEDPWYGIHMLRKKSVSSFICNWFDLISSSMQEVMVILLQAVL